MSRSRHRLGAGLTAVLLMLAGAARAEPPLAPADTARVRRSTAPQVPAPLAIAHAAFLSGQLDLSRQAYHDALRRDPANAAASNGLASLALRSGRTDEAIAWFRHSLTLAPHDALAHARLADLDPAFTAATAESRLRQLIAVQPAEAALHFALGNALARQQRWSEAQQAYFQAHALDPDDPDALFNLAASLDHLRQPALAGDFYRLALAAAARRPAAFDSNEADRRLQALARR